MKSINKQAGESLAKVRRNAALPLSLSSSQGVPRGPRSLTALCSEEDCTDVQQKRLAMRVAMRHARILTNQKTVSDIIYYNLMHSGKVVKNGKDIDR